MKSRRVEISNVDPAIRKACLHKLLAKACRVSDKSAFEKLERKILFHTQLNHGSDGVMQVNYEYERTMEKLIDQSAVRHFRRHTKRTKRLKSLRVKYLPMMEAVGVSSELDQELKVSLARLAHFMKRTAHSNHGITDEQVNRLEKWLIGFYVK